MPDKPVSPLQGESTLANLEQVIADVRSGKCEGVLFYAAYPNELNGKRGVGLHGECLCSPYAGPAVQKTFANLINALMRVPGGECGDIRKWKQASPDGPRIEDDAGEWLFLTAEGNA